MKIRTRLSIFSSIAFGVVFAFTSMIIYGMYSRKAGQSIYSNLEKTSYITAFFFLEEDELNRTEFAKVQQQFEESVVGNQIQVYDQWNRICYGDQNTSTPISILDEIRSKKRLAFEYDQSLCFGIFYEDNQGDFVVISRERKELLDGQIQQLLWILLFCFLAGMLAIVLLSRWLSQIAYRPFSKIIQEVKGISTSDLSVQIASPETKDELQDLTDTFNELLAKISETFTIQRNFVSYVSHEFKTPLASMFGNLEVFSLRERSPEEYAQLSEKLITQIYHMEEVLNTLLVLSDLRKDTDLNLQVRVDELIWEIIAKVSERHTHSKVSVHSSITAEHQALLTVTADTTQLFMALFNLIENAVKYSNGKVVDINLFEKDNRLHLSIVDKGIGIPEEELPHVSKPFYRADNASNVQGSGIGLSISLKIFERNNIQYQITSNITTGTTVSLTF